jgi:hypothetical protein
MFFVRYLCLFVYSGVQQILHCALFFFVFVLCMAVQKAKAMSNTDSIKKPLLMHPF